MNYLYSMFNQSSNHNSMCVFSLLSLKKVHYVTKIYSILTIVLINFLVECYNVQKLKFCICFVHENMKKTPLKVAH